MERACGNVRLDNNRHLLDNIPLLVRGSIRGAKLGNQSPESVANAIAGLRVSSPRSVFAVDLDQMIDQLMELVVGQPVEFLHGGAGHQPCRVLEMRQ